MRIKDHQPRCDNTINALTIGSDFGVSDFVKWAKVTFIHFETIWNVWKWYELGTWDNEVLSPIFGSFISHFTPEDRSFSSQLFYHFIL